MVRVCSLMSKARVWMRNSAFVKEYDWDRLNIMVVMVTGLSHPSPPGNFELVNVKPFPLDPILST